MPLVTEMSLLDYKSARTKKYKVIGLAICSNKFKGKKVQIVYFEVLITFSFDYKFIS